MGSPRYPETAGVSHDQEPSTDVHAIAPQGGGLVHVYTWTDPSQGQDQPTRTLHQDLEWFGIAVALQGDALVVGAPDFLGSDEKAGNGTVFVYERRKNGEWQEQARLTPSLEDKGPGTATAFGEVLDLDLDGDYLVVGDYYQGFMDSVGADEDATNAGAVYVFQRDPKTAWTERAILWSPTPTAFTFFGRHVHVRDRRIVVGPQIAVGIRDTPQATANENIHVFVPCSSGGAYSRDFQASPLALLLSLLVLLVVMGRYLGY